MTDYLSLLKRLQFRVHSHLQFYWVNFSVHANAKNGYKPIITSGKWSLQRLCFHRCLSVHGGGQFAPLHVGIHTPRADTPPGQTPPCPVHAWKHTHPVPTACWDTPPCPVHAGKQSTSGQYASHWNAFLLNLSVQAKVNQTASVNEPILYDTTDYLVNSSCLINRRCESTLKFFRWWNWKIMIRSFIARHLNGKWNWLRGNK